MKKIVNVLLVIVFISFFSFVFSVDQQIDRRQAAHMSKLQEQAKPYEQELAEILRNLQIRKDKIRSMAESGIVIFGFVPVSGDDIPEIKDLIDSHSYTPVIILDCSLDQAVLEDIISKSVKQGYELLPAWISYDDQKLERVEQIRAVLLEYGYEGEISCFIRQSFDTVENQNRLEEIGYQSFVLYSESLNSGITESGSPFISYGFLKEGSAVEEMINQIVSTVSYTVIAIDWSDIDYGVISSSDVDSLFVMADEKILSGELKYSSLSETFRTVINDSRRADIFRTEYEDYEKSQQDRIIELEAIISEIYSHWDRNE